MITDYIIILIIRGAVYARRCYLRPSILWDFTQLRFVIGYQLFGTAYRSRVQGSRDFLTPEDGNDRLSRNVNSEVPNCAA